MTKLVSTKICHRRAQKGASSRCRASPEDAEAAAAPRRRRRPPHRFNDIQVPGAVKFS